MRGTAYTKTHAPTTAPATMAILPTPISATIKPANAPMAMPTIARSNFLNISCYAHGSGVYGNCHLRAWVERAVGQRRGACGGSRGGADGEFRTRRSGIPG